LELVSINQARLLSNRMLIRLKRNQKGIIVSKITPIIDNNFFIKRTQKQEFSKQFGSKTIEPLIIG
jgi:hypothetical protein